MKQQIHQLAAVAAAAASAYPAALAQLAAASSGAFSPEFAAASALAAVRLNPPQRMTSLPAHLPLLLAQVLVCSCEWRQGVRSEALHCGVLQKEGFSGG